MKFLKATFFSVLGIGIVYEQWLLLQPALQFLHSAGTERLDCI